MSRAFAKPVVVVSKCLEFEACRYNGERISASFIEQLEPHVRFRPVCPEVEIGLGTPRDPIRIYLRGERKALYQPATRRHLTRKMNAFSGRYLEGLEEVDGFILKAKSPSCAITDAKIFPTAAAGDHAALGPGLFAEAALEAFGSRAFVDETGLNDAALARVSSPESSPSPPSAKPGNQAASTASPATTQRTSSCSWPAIRRPCARWGESRRIMINANRAKSSPLTKTRSCGSSPARLLAPHT